MISLHNTSYSSDHDSRFTRYILCARLPLPMAEFPPSPRSSAFRTGSIRNFLMQSEDAVSTRGQILPSLIRDRSISNLTDTRGQLPRRKRSAWSLETEGDPDVEWGDGEGVEGEEGERPVEKERERDGSRQEQTRSSSRPRILMTPQMRSMRLIGNSNPRYQW